MHTPFLLSSTLFALGAAAEPRLAPIASLAIEGVTGCEIVSVHAASRRAVVTCSDAGRLVVLDLADPAKPVLLAPIVLGLAAGEELTSAAIHPDGLRVLVAIKTGAERRGRVEIRSLVDGAKLAGAEAGFGCDSVVIAPDGRSALVCDEAEEMVLVGGKLSSPPGSVTLLRLGEGPADLQALPIALTDLSGTPGFAPADAGRYIERPLVGSAGLADFRGMEVSLDGENVLVPLADHRPDLLEPEGAVFIPDGTSVWITLQENNGLLRIDVAKGAVSGVFGLGTTTHPADLKEDGAAAFTTTLTALREPDGIAISADGRYLVTADEGDTDPKASKIKSGKPAGGGRTLTVIDAATGAVVGDTGDGIDTAAAAAGCYPDKRSPAKGSEPEMVATFALDGVAYAVATLERADAVALVALADPAKPRVLGVVPLGKGHKAPEGIAVALLDGTTWVFTANEGSGTVSVLRVER